jgi:glycosyltransferase involved in cell wall biosynthesis
MTVSVIIPVKDDERILQCVAAVMDVISEEKDVEVLVVDNGSPAAFESTLALLPSEVKLLKESSPGAYAARNCAIAVATGDVLFFTDVDALVRPGWIREGLKAIADGADVACGYSGSIGTSRIDQLIQASFDGLCALRKRGDPIPVNCRNVAIRREVLAAIPFDGRFGRGGDTAFGRLAEQAGYRLFFAPAMVADHEHEPSLPLRAAKHVCWGWNAMRLGLTYPDFGRPPGPWIPRARRVTRLTRIPVLKIGFSSLWLVALTVAWLTEAFIRFIPFGLARKLCDGGAMRTARRAGFLLYASGRTETQPTPSEVLRRQLRRD